MTVRVVLSTQDTRLNGMHVPGSRTGIGGQVGVDLTGGNRGAMLKTTIFIWVISNLNLCSLFNREVDRGVARHQHTVGRSLSMARSGVGRLRRAAAEPTLLALYPDKTHV